MSKTRKDNKIKTSRNTDAISAHFRTSAGPMINKKDKRKKPHSCLMKEFYEEEQADLGDDLISEQLGFTHSGFQGLLEEISEEEAGHNW